ncbi:hypothetical protein LINGRAHAP2_LOCUS20798 [Linum grandiflorum]
MFGCCSLKRLVSHILSLRLYKHFTQTEFIVFPYLSAAAVHGWICLRILLECHWHHWQHHLIRLVSVTRVIDFNRPSLSLFDLWCALWYIRVWIFLCGCYLGVKKTPRC